MSHIYDESIGHMDGTARRRCCELVMDNLRVCTEYLPPSGDNRPFTKHENLDLLKLVPPRGADCRLFIRLFEVNNFLAHDLLVTGAVSGYGSSLNSYPSPAMCGRWQDVWPHYSNHVTCARLKNMPRNFFFFVMSRFSMR